jgi:hypothetical protein
MVTVEEIKVVIAVNKRDLWFCRICVASIRYYYTDIQIYLIKDELNGQFSTKEIEKKWNVDVIEFEKQKFGWSAAKMFLYTDPRFDGKYLFVLDSDIVMIGKLLDYLMVNLDGADVFISVEKEVNPYADWVENVYFNVKKIQENNSNYSYPGYFFNAGQLLVKGGFIARQDVQDNFDFNNYPFWKNLSLLPLVDQSLFNYLFPIMEKQGRLRINSSYKYMLWSRSDEVEQININKIDSVMPCLIHWAGDLRSPFLSRMNGSEILIFFENSYYSKIKFGSIIRYLRRYEFLIYTLKKRIASKLKSYLR